MDDDGRFAVADLRRRADYYISIFGGELITTARDASEIIILMAT